MGTTKVFQNQKVQQELLETMKQFEDQELKLEVAKKRFQVSCTHKRVATGASNIRLATREELRRRYYWLYDREDDEANTKVICNECKALFEMEPFSREQLENSIFTLQSALQQLKLLVQFNGEEDPNYIKIQRALTSLDLLEDGVLEYYLRAIELILGEKREKEKKKIRRTSKGNFNVPNRY